MKIAVVGSGVAGLTCGHVLDPYADVTLFEADSRLGGHANTFTVTDPIAGKLAIDTGFIVHNDRNYPKLTRLLSDLAVPVQDTEMSFAVTYRRLGSQADIFTYRSTSISSLFADRRNLIRPEMWRMLRDITRFYRSANRLLKLYDKDPASIDPTYELETFLTEGRYSQAFVDLHLLPMGASIWSADPTNFSAFPCLSLFRFLRNHGLLGFRDRPQWRTIIGGSHVYVNAIATRFSGTIKLKCPVTAVSRSPAGPLIQTSLGTEEFDHVVLACHSDQALALLSKPSTVEKEVLGAISYQPNTATLHTDTSVLSPNPRAWSAWNYECPSTERDPRTLATLTYDMTTLQRLPGPTRYLISLNSDYRIDPSAIIANFNYEHPILNEPAISAQKRHREISGIDGIHFCGAYWGYGFHEDGVASAIRVCEGLGVDW